MIGAWRATLQRSMWSTTVVVGGVPGEDGPKVPLAEDQDAVSELGSNGQDETWLQGRHRWSQGVTITL
jgi:hypothetical protein